MTTLLQPGNHPDADQLTAFAENALPPHEQQQTLAHLATCADCRNLVYLAQQASPIELPQPQPIPAHRAWFASWKLAFPAAAALACLIFLTIHLRTTTTPQNPPPTAVVVQQTPPPPLPAAQATIPAPLAATSAQPSRPPRSSCASRPAPPQPAIAADAMAAAALLPLSPQSPPATLRAFNPSMQVPPGGAIEGTVTDPSGAVIPHAKVTAVNTDTGVFLNRETAATGTFSIPSLQAGDYNIEVSAPGFQRVLQENVHVEPLQQIALNMKLNVGGDNQTVTVTNAPPSLDTTNATLGGTIENELYTELPLSTGAAPRASAPSRSRTPQQTAQATSSGGLQQGVYGGTGQTNLNENYVEGIPTSNVTSASAAAAQPATINANTFALAAKPKLQPTLPSHLPALSTVTNARQALAIDTAGALFRSEDAGVTWTPIATQWKGRATRLALAHPSGLGGGQAMAKSGANTVAAAPQPTPQTFELTTDTNATYTSTDGQTWHLK